MDWKPDYRRLLNALYRNGEPDRVPLVELGISKEIKEAYLNRPVTSVKDEVDFALKARYDYVKLQPVVDMNPANILPPGQDKGEKIEVEGEIRWANEHKGVIRSEEDFDKYVFPDFKSIDYSRFKEIEKHLPEGMAVIGQYGDIFTKTWEMMGFETFSISLFSNPPLIEKLFNKIGDIVVNMFENMAKLDVVKVLWYSDDIAYASGLMVSPETLRKYFFPFLKKIGDIAGKNGKPLIYHTDGKLWQVFEDIVDCGVNAIHPIEPKAMDIEEVKEKYGDKLCVIGNIDLSYTLTRGTPEETIEEVKSKLRKTAPGGGYCLGSSNSIPNYVKLENFVAMIETCKKYGKYPINV